MSRPPEHRMSPPPPAAAGPMAPTSARRTRAELIAEAMARLAEVREAAGRCTASAEPDAGEIETARREREH